MRRVLLLALGGAAALVVLATCGESTQPVAGVLEVVLSSPNSGQDSAIMLTVTGPRGLTSAQAGTGLRMFSQPLGGMPSKFALVGRLDGGAVLLTIGITDLSQSDQYHATIDQIALPSFQLRQYVGYYSLTLTK